MVALVRDQDGFHLGTELDGGPAYRRRRSQLPGTVIHHAGPVPRTADPLPIAVVEPAFLAGAIATASPPCHHHAGEPPTRRAAVDLSPVAASADGKLGLAARAATKSMVGHVLARAKFLAMDLNLSEGAWVADVLARTGRSRGCSSRPSSFLSRAAPSYPGAPRLRSFWRPAYWPRSTRIRVAVYTRPQPRSTIRETYAQLGGTLAFASHVPYRHRHA